MAGFWEEPEQVKRFAAREPDARLAELVLEFRDPKAVRALDLGCAGGRNTVFLAERGFDVFATDASRAMVEKTRVRVSKILGAQEAARRIRVGRMDRLDRAESESFDLLVALGVYHCAESRREWDGSLAESARVLKPGGRLLVSVFTPQTDLTGDGIRPIAGEADVYEGFPGGGRSFLVNAAVLDREMAHHGLFPLAPTETVTREAGRGRRVSANGLYIKPNLGAVPYFGPRGKRADTG